MSRIRLVKKYNVMSSNYSFNSNSLYVYLQREDCPMSKTTQKKEDNKSSLFYAIMAIMMFILQRI